MSRKKDNKKEIEKNKHHKKGKKKIFIIFIEITLVFVMIISGINIFKWINENKSSKEILDKVEKAVTVDEEKKVTDIEKYNINFAELKSQNANTVAWLKVNGTDIEYPVVKGSDNNFYLDHSFDDTYNSAGWPFADYKNKFDGTDKNIIVYGHNRKDGSMFGTLKYFYTEEWYNNLDNRKILFYTENEQSVYDVFSVYTIEDEAYYIQTSFTNNFGQFVEKIKSRSEREFDIEVDENDKILTLSTCGAGNTRVVLHARKER